LIKRWQLFPDKNERSCYLNREQEQVGDYSLVSVVEIGFHRGLSSNGSLALYERTAGERLSTLRQRHDRLDVR
jgi:hypothetical protein